MAQTHVEKLQAKIDKARTAGEQVDHQVDEALDKYNAAITAGDMDRAREAKAEADRLKDEARVHADRVKALQDQIPEARAKDAKPAHDAACKALTAALEGIVEAESEAHKAAAAYGEAIAKLERHREEATRQSVRLRKLSEAGGLVNPAFARPVINPNRDVFEHARRHAGNASMLSQAYQTPGLTFRPAKSKAA
jgi:predicted  nucleic acid-binding Zn-ribbon protein